MSILFDPYAIYTPKHTSLALSVSLITHAILFGLIGWTTYQHRTELTNTPTLSVVLVNRKTSSAPQTADSWAQANLEGGGEPEQKGHTSSLNKFDVPTPLKQTNSNQKSASSSTDDHTATAQQNSQAASTPYLMRRGPSHVVIRPITSVEEQLQASQAAQDSLTLNLAAKLAPTLDLRQAGSESKVLGARTREYRFASYFSQWRAKIEHVGTAHYRKITAPGEPLLKGNVSIALEIHHDGHLIKATIRKSSGNPKIDQMMLDIAHQATPFPPFPDALRAETPVHTFTSSWKFEKSDQLEAGDE
jgi:periplasmic protein TonB